jgi:hypothetical protein
VHINNLIPQNDPASAWHPYQYMRLLGKQKIDGATPVTLTLPHDLLLQAKIRAASLTLAGKPSYWTDVVRIALANHLKHKARAAR